MRRIIFCFVFLLCLHSVNAQETIMNYGLKVGPTLSSIRDLETTILWDPTFIDYSLKKKARLGFAAGAFLNYRFTPTLALYSEMMYSQQGSDLSFTNFHIPDSPFNWKMSFKYQYMNILAMVKLYPLGQNDDWLEGLNVGVGPQVGLSLSPEKIVYTSDGPGKREAFGPDLLIQQQLRNVLKGKTNFGFLINLGYEFKKEGKVWDAISFDFRYYYGISDVVETQANSYNFIENKNTNSCFTFLVGWDFSFFNK